MALGTARGLECRSGLGHEFSGGHQGGEMEDGRPGTRLSAMLERVFITWQISALYLHSPFGSALSFSLFTSNPTLVKNREIKCVPLPKRPEKVMIPVHT